MEPSATPPEADKSSSNDEYASADEYPNSSSSEGTSPKAKEKDRESDSFSPIGIFSRSRLRPSSDASRGSEDGASPSRLGALVAPSGSGGRSGSPAAAVRRDVATPRALSLLAPQVEGAPADRPSQPERRTSVDAAEGDDEASESGSPGVIPLAARNLDSGTDMQLFKVYTIHDSVSGAEWLVDGGVDPKGDSSAAWREKRVKDSRTGEITSLAELEKMLVARVEAQLSAHRVRDLDTGVEIDLFQDVAKESLVESVRKEMIVLDQDSNRLLSLAELQDLLVPPKPEEKKKRRRLKIQAKNVKRIAAKMAEGIQASISGLHVQPDRTLSSGEEINDGKGVAYAGQSVKVQVNRKQFKELSHLRVAQELDAHEGLIWAMQFSRNGDYLASGGEDEVVRVWEVVKAHARLSRQPSAIVPVGAIEGSAGGEPGGAANGLAREVFHAKPYREFRGHTNVVLDLSWSTSGFLLSSSMDKTVRLWHISVDGECLRVFQHTDFVTVVDFHPQNDKLFISGSIDGKVRLWNLANVRVIDFADCHEMVTAAAFSPDGEQVAVGTKAGKCRFYACENSKMSYSAQLDVCTNKSHNRKITGVQFLPGQPDKVLVTSNDSRIRLYDTCEYRQLCKYKGHQTREAQIRATFSGDGKYVVCGSDQGAVYVWPTVNPLIPAVNPSYTGFRKDKNASYESFQAHADMVTAALFAPETTHSPAWQSTAGGSVPPATRAATALLQTSLGPVRGCFVPSPGSLQGEDGPDDRDSEGHPPDTNDLDYNSRMVILATGTTGEIKVFENFGPPTWL